MAITWGSIFKDKPAGGDAPSTLDNQQRVHREAVEERAENEHDTFEDGTSGLASADWRHKEGSARAYYQSGEPSNQPGANGAALGTDDDGRIWVNSDDKIVKVWDGDSFEEINPFRGIAVLKHQLDGAYGGQAVNTTWTKRVINVEETNTISGMSLANSVITLPAGTYKFHSTASFHLVGGVKMRLRNTSDGSTTLLGTSERSHSTSFRTNHSEVNGVFTIAIEKDFELQYYVLVSGSGTQDLGYRILDSDDEDEVYVIIIIEKIG